MSALLGFAFSLLLARLLGAQGSGVALQAIAAFTIVLSVARLGMDTCAVWILPPMAITEPRRVPRTLAVLLLSAGLTSVLLGGAWWLLVQLTVDGAPAARREVLDTMAHLAPFLPPAALMVVALACTRAFGGVLPFNVVMNLLVPSLRVAALVLAVALGGAVVAVSVGWGAAWAIGAVAALGILVVQARRAVPRGERLGAPVRSIFGFALPRTLSSALEQAVIWLDVILVGLIAGNAAAGVYGAASRFVAAGVIVSTAVRIVVAPRFSALLAAERHGEVRQLYSVTALWILLFGAPIYLGLAVFAPTVLGWLGPDFGAGVPSMVVLCLGSVLVLAAGNIQSLLLMSGKASWAAMNKAVVVAVNIVGNVVLVPQVGITGAAVTWALSMFLDTSLAAWQTHRATGLVLSWLPVLRTAAMVVVGVVVPSLLVVMVAGQGTTQLLVAAALSAVALAGLAYMDRTHLHLHELRVLGGRRAAVL